jgi:hypothetical protein
MVTRAQKQYLSTWEATLSRAKNMEDFVFQVLGVNKFTQEILHLKKENLLLKKIHHFISNLKPNNKPNKCPLIGLQISWRPLLP